MRLLARLRSAYRDVFRSPQLERDLDAELQFALDELTARHKAKGLSPQAAARAARLELGSLDQIKEQVRARGVMHAAATGWRDIRLAWRSLRRSPAVTGTVVIVLAVGIGAATAIFSIGNALLLSPLPYRGADRLVFIWQDLTRAGYPRAPLSGPELQDLRERSRLFAGFGGIWANTVALTGDAEPEQLRVGLVTANFFDVLGADAVLGRTFRPEDEAPDAPRAILLSAALFERRYGSDPNVVGRRIQVDHAPATVVGVMPASFRLLLPTDSAIPDDQQAWLPLGLNRLQGPRQQQFLRVVGRLEPYVTLEAGQQEVAGIAQQVGREFVEYGSDGATFYAVGLQDDATREVRPALVALLGAVGLLLAMGCINAAGLLLTRAAGRQQETALRMALGASRYRLFRQLLAEGLVLSCAGGAAGVLVAYWVLDTLIAFRPPALIRIDATQLDLRALALAAAMSVACGVLFSLAPFVQVFRTRLSGILHAGGRSGLGGNSQRVRTALVATQIAISSVLVVTAGLLARGSYELSQVDLGFSDEGVITFKLSLGGTRYRSHEHVNALSRQLRDRLRALPGVEAAGAISHLPYDTVPNWGTAYLPEHVGDPTQAGLADARAVLPGYFEAVGAELVEGRWFADSDEATHPIAIVDTRMATRVWPGESAIGKRLAADPGTTGVPEVAVTVVGVVRHMRHREITRDLREQIYFPASQSFRNPMAYAIRTTGAPADLVPAVRGVLRELDPTLPIYDVRPLGAYTGDASAMRGFTLVLALVFAGSALLLASIGVYGVSAAAAAQRRREFGVRLALGAQARQVLALVLRDGARVAVAGVAAGSLGALAAAELIRTQLYRVSPRDPAIYAGGVALVVFAGLLACCLPAWRAARASPLESLRVD